MQSLFNRRHALRMLASAALPAVALHPRTVLAAAGPTPDRAPVQVLMSLANGFTLPPTTTAGWVPFAVSTPDVSGGFLHYLQGFQPRAGVSAEQVIEDFRLALSRELLVAAEGIRALARDAELVGGAAVDANTTVTATLPLRAGTYRFVDLNDFFVPGQTVNLQTLEVTAATTGPVPSAPAAGEAAATGTVTMVKTGNAHRFASRQTLPATGRWRVFNTTDQIHELALQRTLPGAVDADIQRFFEGKGPSPFAESTLRGLAAISPGRGAMLRLDGLPAGSYAMQCFAADDALGIPHAIGGMHKVINLLA